MAYQWGIVIADMEVEQDLEIVAYYFGRKHGIVDSNFFDHAFTASYRLFGKKGFEALLLLTNKVIAALERRAQEPKAA
jgi:hypothetical protein